MPTYYEILKIQSTATITEIETALDEQYNQWRRLVTHHDPNVVNQANQALQTLEMIRATLIDLEKRSVYDAAIGVNGPVGGLADPETLLRASVPPIRLASTQRTDQVPPTAANARLDGWVCAQCQTTNPIKTRFCSKCGQQLGLDCPNCGKLTKASDAYCMECGVNIEEFEHKRNAEEEERLCLEKLEDEALKKWLPSVLEQATHGSGYPLVTVLRLSGPYDRAFKLVMERIADPATFQDKVGKVMNIDLNYGIIFRIEIAEPNQGYISAKARADPSRIQAWLQKSEFSMIHLVLSFSRKMITLPSIKNRRLNQVISALQKAPLNAREVHLNYRYKTLE